MSDNLDVNERPFTPQDFPTKARQILANHLATRPHGKQPMIKVGLDDIYVVWFNFTLGNWKALLSTTVPDGRYYEITHRVGTDMVFVDTYQKIDNTEVAVLEYPNVNKHRYTHPSSNTHGVQTPHHT